MDRDRAETLYAGMKALLNDEEDGRVVAAALAGTLMFTAFGYTDSLDEALQWIDEAAEVAKQHLDEQFDEMSAELKRGLN